MARAIPIDLVEAVQRGEVSLEAKPENSFAETRLKLENKTSQQLELDLSRSGLIPQSGDAQRIGLCHPVGFQPGDYVHTHNLASDYLPTYTLDGTNPYLEDD